MPVTPVERNLVEDENSSTLYHFSEDNSIRLFVPRNTTADDATEELVWAISPESAPLYYFPRDCPRVCFRCWQATTPDDRKFFTQTTSARMVIAIENDWYDRLR